MNLCVIITLAVFIQNIPFNLQMQIVVRGHNVDMFEKVWAWFEILGSFFKIDHNFLQERYFRENPSVCRSLHHLKPK
jgi:hypothetical protein